MTLHLKMATPLVLTEKRPRSTFVCLSIIKKLNAITFLKAMEKSSSYIPTSKELWANITQKF